MFRRVCILTPRFLFVLCLAFLGSLPSGAETVRIPGSHIALTPPPDFVPAQQFAGFQQEETGSSIMVHELPAPADKLRETMTKENLASREMTLLGSETLDLQGKQALLLHLRQHAHGITFLKWLLIGGDDKESFIVTGIYPEDFAEEVGASIRNAVLSAHRVNEAPGDPFEGLTFRLQEGPRLKIAMRMGNMLGLSENRKKPPLAADDAFFVVGSSLNTIDTPDFRAYAKLRASRTEQIDNLTNLRERSLRVDGMEAYEILADATDKKSGKPILFYQVMAKDGQNYMLFQGFVSAQRGPEFLPEFRALTASFKRKAKNTGS